MTRTLSHDRKVNSVFKGAESMQTVCPWEAATAAMAPLQLLRHADAQHAPLGMPQEALADIASQH